MDPTTATSTLRGRGWSDQQIAEACGCNTSTVFRIRARGQEATWALGEALIALAKSKRKPESKAA
jgi:hypothetical protein